MAARFRAEETLPGTREQIVTVSVAALQACRFVVIDSDGDRGWIRARAPINVRSWGEDITVTVGADGQVEIVSECRLATQILDWGKNRANVAQLLSKLRSAF
ncbi:hypothetical protein [Dactylosporangium sp. NPDC048998]|uniref:hypothetical protein n=1 Tax=Dactylosporangium sp. NPDC048998 TaxID=3363976 RepID=UPI003722EA70